LAKLILGTDALFAFALESLRPSSLSIVLVRCTKEYYKSYSGYV